MSRERAIKDSIKFELATDEYMDKYAIRGKMYYHLDMTLSELTPKAVERAKELITKMFVDLDRGLEDLEVYND